MSAFRSRRRPMATAVWELMLGPVLCWAIVVGNALIALLITIVAFVAFGTPSQLGQAANVILALVALYWWGMVIQFFVGIVYRPRARAFSFVAAGQTVSEGIEIPGSRRLPAQVLISAVVLIALFIAIALASPVGWAVFCFVVVGLLLVAVFSLVSSLRHRRRLVLSPSGLRASVYRVDAGVGWDDISEISYVQGMTGTMVLRVGVKPGAVSYQEFWRHPFSRNYFGRGVGRIEVEPGALDVDALLLFLALRVYWMVPGSRSELGGGRAPERLFDAEVALNSTPLEVTEMPMRVLMETGKPLQLFRPRWE